MFEARECSFILTDLLASPYSLIQGSHVLVRVRFLNDIDWSEWSPDSVPIAMQTVPKKPPQPPSRVAEFTFGTNMGIKVEELVGDDTGGAPILAYRLEIDSSGGGSGPWTLVQESLELQAVI